MRAILTTLAFASLLAVPGAADARSSGTTIKVRPSQYGDVIWNANRQAIYLFTKEKGSKSRCYGACAEAWPPVLTSGAPIAGSGARKDLLGTTKRSDGKTQVTYGGHPLYYYDEPRGKIFCHDVNEFGGDWLVVKPDGAAVR